MSNTEIKVLGYWKEQIRNGNMPPFGSPETKCVKCMFNGICVVDDTCVGCLGGWKRENE